MACVDGNIQLFARMLAIGGHVLGEQNRSLKKSGMHGIRPFQVLRCVHQRRGGALYKFPNKPGERIYENKE
jgi:hypothetical protein